MWCPGVGMAGDGTVDDVETSCQGHVVSMATGNHIARGHVKTFGHGHAKPGQGHGMAWQWYHDQTNVGQHTCAGRGGALCACVSQVCVDGCERGCAESSSVFTRSAAVRPAIYM